MGRASSTGETVSQFARVYALLCRRGGMLQSEIARELGYSPKSSADNALMALEHAGFLVYVEDNGTVKPLETTIDG